MRLKTILGVSLTMLVACQDPAPETESARSTAMNPPAPTAVTPMRIPVATMAGDSTCLADLGGKACLVVNVASECGFTPQYEGLEALYREYSARGLVVVGFPCNQFGGQEPGSDEQIMAFCRSRYGVSFPVMSKIEVKGGQQHDLYRRLTRDSERPGEIKWNFTKFLLDPQGRVTARFEPAVEPLSDQVREAIEALL